MTAQEFKKATDLIFDYYKEKGLINDIKRTHRVRFILLLRVLLEHGHVISINTVRLHVNRRLYRHEVYHNFEIVKCTSRMLSAKVHIFKLLKKHCDGFYREVIAPRNKEM